jgi:hypothetical protein
MLLLDKLIQFEDILLPRGQLLLLFFSIFFWIAWSSYQRRCVKRQHFLNHSPAPASVMIEWIALSNLACLEIRKYAFQLVWSKIDCCHAVVVGQFIASPVFDE